MSVAQARICTSARPTAGFPSTLSRPTRRPRGPPRHGRRGRITAADRPRAPPPGTPLGASVLLHFTVSVPRAFPSRPVFLALRPVYGAARLTHERLSKAGRLPPRAAAAQGGSSCEVHRIVQMTDAAGLAAAAVLPVLQATRAPLEAGRLKSLHGGVGKKRRGKGDGWSVEWRFDQHGMVPLPLPLLRVPAPKNKRLGPGGGGKQRVGASAALLSDGATTWTARPRFAESAVNNQVPRFG
mmetsp:Transcript_42522/g.127525  ORF Transcript_42522/g.127525 Transcript_42522/m.127525 type:complete len:240 (-) Transcript_42522:45-764(-)|eukprot:115692-Chlamydomonas_euryale.AAC.3